MLLELMEKHIMKKEKKIISKIVFCIMTFLLISCKTSLQNSYKSNYMLYGKPSTILNLNDDNSFQYFFRYNQNEIKGDWKRIKDTLILTSDIFNIKNDTLLRPKVKESDFENVDKYLIKRKKLYLINKNGVDKKHFLYLNLDDKLEIR